MTTLTPRPWRDPAYPVPPAGFAQKLLAALYPPRCAICGHRGVTLCGHCAAMLAELHAAAPRPSTQEGYLGVVAPWRYTGEVRHAMLRLKYYDERWRAAEFGRQLCVAAENAIYAAAPRGLPLPQLVVSVPDAPETAAKKPYAVPALLAAALARHFGVPYARSLLQKPVETPPQHKLPFERRLHNPVGAFAVARPKALAGKTVWLVDDVATSGATLKTCARVLWLYGAKQVVGCCFGITPPPGERGPATKNSDK